MPRKGDWKRTSIRLSLFWDLGASDSLSWHAPTMDSNHLTMPSSLRWTTLLIVLHWCTVRNTWLESELGSENVICLLVAFAISSNGQAPRLARATMSRVRHPLVMKCHCQMEKLTLISYVPCVQTHAGSSSCLDDKSRNVFFKCSIRHQKRAFKGALRPPKPVTHNPLEMIHWQEDIPIRSIQCWLLCRWIASARSVKKMLALTLNFVVSTDDYHATIQTTRESKWQRHLFVCISALHPWGLM